MTKKERAQDLVTFLKQTGVQSIATGTNPHIDSEEIVINFANLPNSNVENTQFNYTILDDGFIVFIGPLYKCNNENLNVALRIVNRMNQQPFGKFYIDDNGCVCMKQMDNYIDNSQQLAGEFIRLYQNVIRGDLINLLKNNL